MAESPSHTPASPTPNSEVAGAGDDVVDHWCYHCNKRVSVETVPNEPDVICHECKNGFVESIQPNPIEEEANFGSQFLQMLRIIAQAAREDDAPPSEEPPPPRSRSVDDFLRIEVDGWDNHDDEEEDEEDANGGGDGNNDRNDGHESDNDEDDTDEDYAEYLRRRRRDILRVRIRDLATRSNRSGRNRILDWAEILMGLEDNSIEFRWEVPESESNRYIGNPEDYLDAAGFEELLQNLAESDGGRRGAPPAAKVTVLRLPQRCIIKKMSADPVYQDWDTSSHDYHKHVVTISRMTSINPDLPRYPTVHKAFNHRVIPLEDTDRNKVRSRKKKSQRRVRINEHGTVIEEDDGDLEVEEEGVDDEADGFTNQKRKGFELCKWRTFKL